MLSRIAQTVERYRMFRPGERAGVAVSGGADSVCLLHVLVELAPQWGLRLSILHLNHMLRGEESRADAEFVRGLAARSGLEAIVREVDVAASADNLEQAARAARLAFFRETIASGAVDRVALGHTRSDQAETVLFRFLRGAGSAGLAGIRPVTSEGIVRPLIEIDRTEVEAFLRERGVAWREDSSNRDSQFARNRIRHELLPQLASEWNPAIVETLSHTADWALAEESYWADEIERLAAARLVEREGTVFLRVDSLRGLPVAAARRLLRYAMERVKGDLRSIDFRHVAAVFELASSTEGSGRVMPPGLDVFRSFEWLRIGRPVSDGLANRNYRVPAPVPGIVRVPGTPIEVSLQVIENPEPSELSDCVYNEKMACLDWRLISSPLELRNWRPGDQYQPVGGAGETKIKTLFQDARIPLWERRHWPVLTAGPTILWARRFGPAARFAAGTDSKVILRVRDGNVDGTK